MVSLLSTKFHEILFSSFRGVTLTKCVTDRRRDGQDKNNMSPHKSGGRHNYCMITAMITLVVIYIVCIGRSKENYCMITAMITLVVIYIGCIGRSKENYCMITAMITLVVIYIGCIGRSKENYCMITAMITTFTYSIVTYCL